MLRLLSTDIKQIESSWPNMGANKQTKGPTNAETQAHAKPNRPTLNRVCTRVSEDMSAKAKEADRLPIRRAPTANAGRCRSRSESKALSVRSRPHASTTHTPRAHVCPTNPLHVCAHTCAAHGRGTRMQTSTGPTDLKRTYAVRLAPLSVGKAGQLVGLPWMNTKVGASLHR